MGHSLEHRVVHRRDAVQSLSASVLHQASAAAKLGAPRTGTAAMMGAMRGPMRWAAGAAAAAMLAAGTWWILDVRASTPVDLTRLTEAQWHEDLHAMAQGVARRHVNAFHRVSREQYQELVGQIDVALHGAPGPDVPVLFERLTAAVGDAHTYVNITDDQHYYPFITYRFGDDWRVARALPEERDLLGARLVKIDDADMGRVEAGLHEILTQGENRWFYLFNEPWFLTGEVLHALRLVRDPAAVTFTFARDDGTTFTRTMGPHSGDPEMVRAYQHPPLYLEHKDADFWFTTLPGTRALYLVFNGYEQLRANAARLFEALDQGADALIVDLRGNAGGDYL
ncbi:MAG: hypothetical protein ABSE49_16145, partial [Polyangiaceae bacterium]